MLQVKAAREYGKEVRNGIFAEKFDTEVGYEWFCIRQERELIFHEQIYKRAKAR